MFKVIVKTKNYETFKQLETMDLVNAWIESDKQWWGLPERPELDEMGQPTGVILPAEYTIEIEDITAQVEAEKAQIEAIKNAQVQAGLRLQDFPAQVDACQDLNELKLAIKQMVQDIAVLLR